MAQARSSVIIPLHHDGPAFRSCLDGCLDLDHPDFEVLVVSDRPVDIPPPARLVLTGSGADTPPGVKRDIGIKHATGDVLAFIDDDAVPRSDWLLAADRALADPAAGAVGGPGLTPPNSGWRERAGGAFYESRLGSGPHRHRFVQLRRREVDDHPAYNLVVRRAAIEQIGGWGTTFYGGEDTLVCLALVEAGWKLLYDPDVVVYHMRRPIWRQHLAQVGNVGRHRGFFVKAFPKTSLRPSYFLPSVGTLALGLLLAASVFRPEARPLLAGSLAVFAVGGFVLGLAEQRDVFLAVLLPAVAVFSHIAYGIQFIRGLFTRRLER